MQQNEILHGSFEEAWGAIEDFINRMEDYADSNFTAKVFDTKEFSIVYTTVYNQCTKRSHQDVRSDHSRRKPLSRGRGAAGVASRANAIHGRMSEDEKTPQEKLYEKYKLWIRRYLESRVVESIREKHGVELLMELVKRWENHKIIIRWLKKLFAYLDRYHTSQAGVDTLHDVGMTLFREKVFDHVKKEILGAVLEKIEEERCGIMVDKSILKVSIEVFVEMGMGDVKKVYKPEFEIPLLENTKRFYALECASWFNTDSCPEYLEKAERRLQEEDIRVDMYLHSNTRSLLIRAVEDELLKKHQSSLLHMPNSGFVFQLRNMHRENLGLMYRMFRRLPSDSHSGIRPMADLFRDEIVTQGRHMVSVLEQDTNSDPVIFILDLLRMQTVYVDLIREQFDDSAIFLKGMREGFERFVNVQVTNRSARVLIAEMLANFADVMLKSSREKYTDEDIDSIFDKFVHLFQYIHDKDFFHDKYRKLLAERLLDTNVKENDERIIISKLKMKHGAAFTSKLETMITDRNMSFDLMNDFKKWSRSLTLPIREFQAFVLTTGSWPHYPVDKMRAPEELAESMQIFKNFYDTKTKNRILQWIHSLSKATLRATFACGPRQMNMSGYQAAVCLLFNTHQELSVTSVIDILGLPPSETKRAIMGLVAGRRKVLTRSGKGKSLSKSELLSFNEGLHEPKKIFDIPTPKVTTTSKSGGGDKALAISSETDMERKHMIDACIVRVMKARRHLTHAELVAEVLSQLNLFRPEPRLIKTRLEDLITRDFLSRDEKESQLYHYMA